MKIAYFRLPCPSLLLAAMKTVDLLEVTRVLFVCLVIHLFIYFL